MLDGEKLLKAIDAAIQGCRNPRHAPGDEPSADRQKVELATLVRHREMAREAGDDQSELEQVVQSLERNHVVGFQRWREMSTS